MICLNVMYSRDYTKLYANVKKLREGVKAFLDNKR
nr:MAG TPA: hypothetical protein [Caudoviricetes sp.]DAM15965.1 MAG TPA: hypothetical protein [Caudoviricetes sp.]